jgi:hypothetical protein
VNSPKKRRRRKNDDSAATAVSTSPLNPQSSSTSPAAKVDSPSTVSSPVIKQENPVNLPIKKENTSPTQQSRFFFQQPSVPLSFVNMHLPNSSTPSTPSPSSTDTTNGVFDTHYLPAITPSPSITPPTKSKPITTPDIAKLYITPPSTLIWKSPTLFPQQQAAPVSSQIVPLDDDDQEQETSALHNQGEVNDSADSLLQSSHTITTTTSTTTALNNSLATSSHAVASLRINPDLYHPPSIHRSLKYLWSFYIESTSRFCAIHDFDTPFVSSVVPMAFNNPALQTSLMYLSSIYRNRILGFQDPNQETIAAELSVRTMRSLRGHLSLNLTPSDALVGITACLGLACCYIGENNSEHYNTHLYGGLMVATQVLVPNKNFHLSLEAWFVFKWLTYCQILLNVNLLPIPERLVMAKAQNLPAMQKLYNWWQEHASEDPEYYLPVDSFYGFGTRLAPMLLQLNILVTRDALYSLGNTTVQPSSQEEIEALESELWGAYESSQMAKYSSVGLRQTDIDLLHCDASFHGAALLYVYTYLKVDEFTQKERIPYLVLSVIEEVQAISPVCRTAGALMFVMYIAGSYATGDQRKFIHDHLDSMHQTCLSSVSSVLRALELIWHLRDTSDLPIKQCHRKVCEAGINVCVY